jgi:starch-binding outer membrane protein, SusD/RagB family
MKRLLIIFLLLLNLFSCKKLFKEDIQNTFTLKTEKDYEIALAGLYNRLFNSILGEKIKNSLVGEFPILAEVIGNEDDLCILGMATGGINATYFNSNCNECEFDLNSSLYSYKEVCREFGGGSNVQGEDYSPSYQLLFQTIADANEMLSAVGDINRLNSYYRKIIGDVYFIRAYTYFRLARIYGQVPIVTNTDVDFTLKKPSFTTLYNFIVSDLLKAIELLPISNNEARIKFETPHRGTAKALLAEVYLTMGGYPVYDYPKYADAAKTAGEVIDSAAFFGYGLMPDLADLWNGQHFKNAESEFSFYFSDSTRSSEKENINLNKFFNQFGYGPNYNLLFCKFLAAPDFYNSFPKNYRKEITFQTRRSIFELIWDSDLNNYVPKDSILVYHFDSINQCTAIHFKKFYTQFSVPDSTLKNYILSLHNHSFYFFGYYTGNVVYILRYAQTLLTYAEAKARSGIVDASAYEALNMIRRRANKVDIYSPSPYDLTPGLSPEQFADSVVQERAWELCAEPEGRWFDLMRLDHAKNLPAIKQHQGIVVYPIPIDRNTYFRPIPEKDKELNPNLR